MTEYMHSKIKNAIRRLTPRIVLDGYHRALAFLGAAWYRFPSRHLIIIGVTGTKGKTSTVYLIAKILEHAGYAVGVISGLEARIGKTVTPRTAKITMPGRFFIQRHLRQMVDAACTHVIIEVTSEGIEQHRHRNIDFDIAVFTNIAPEHLEAHGSFNAYLAAKQKLFAALAASRRIKTIKGKRVTSAKTIIVNGDDDHADDFLAFPADRRYACHIGLEEKDDAEVTPAEHVRAVLLDVGEAASVFSVQDIPFRLHVPGTFNVMNSLLATTVGRAEGISLRESVAALEAVKSIPGRMEDVSTGGRYRVIVDYAHTPQSLEAVYRTLRSSQVSPFGPASRRLICVLGAAGGGRDRWKRPVLGAIAGTWCDEVIVTNEDPYDEDPSLIMEQVSEGVRNAAQVYRRHMGTTVMPRSDGAQVPFPVIIDDRRAAIREALLHARLGDTVVITGKGSEQAMAVASGTYLPWDDRRVVREELAKLGTA